MDDKSLDLIGTREAARRLGVSRWRVWQLIEAGRLSARRVGRDWLIDPADLAAVGDRKPGRPATLRGERGEDGGRDPPDPNT